MVAIVPADAGQEFIEIREAVCERLKRSGPYSEVEEKDSLLEGHWFLPHATSVTNFLPASMQSRVTCD